jgi:mercuric ion transport protein
MNNNLKTKTASASILAAIAASLCCITPVLAFLGGIGGIAATFSWLEPFRPYLIGITILVLGFAWYQQLKPSKQEIDCDCEEETGKTKFLHSKKFLGIVTVVALFMLTFPSYSHVFYPATENSGIAVSDNVNLVEFEIKGMTCTGCEQHVNYEVHQLPGILETQVSYESANALVKFDASQVSEDEITDAINSTGYTVIGLHKKNPAEMISNSTTTSKPENH